MTERTYTTTRRQTHRSKPASRSGQRWGAGVISLLAMMLVPGIVNAKTEWGFTPFPHDFTAEAMMRSYKILADDATLFAVHRDNGIPWIEALEGKEFPKKVREDWQTRRDNIKKHHKVYLGLAPLSQDRETLAHISEGSKTKKSFRKKALNSPDVKKAYLNYARRAVEYFKPHYLNLGIEVGELPHRNVASWRQFEELYDHVKNSLKKEYPDMQIGISFGLQSLMLPKIAKLSKSLIEKSDYVGISFYPYMSEFHEALGSDPLPPPPEQWTAPLNWLRAYTDKPIAICETGYTTRPVTLSQPKLKMTGNESLQKRFVRDLAAIAARDDYLFVAWFLPTDYKALSERAGFKQGDVNRLWEYIGLFGPDLKPKPAWADWQQAVRGEIAKAAPAAKGSAKTKVATKPAQPAASRTKVIHALDLGNAKDLFKGSWHDKIKVSDKSPNGSGKSMRWSYEYADGRYQWALAKLDRGLLKRARGMKLWARGKQEGAIVVQFEEKSGEAWWKAFPVNDGWIEVELDFSDFQRDESKARQDERFSAADVISVMLADPGGTQGASGKQKVWIADWTFF